MDQSQLAAIGQWLRALQGLEREFSELKDPARTTKTISRVIDDLDRTIAFEAESTSFLADLHALAPKDP